MNPRDGPKCARQRLSALRKPDVAAQIRVGSILSEATGSTKAAYVRLTVMVSFPILTPFVEE